MTELDDMERELLVEGLDDYVGLWEFISVLRNEDPSVSDERVRERVLASVRRLLEAGYMEPGALLPEGGFKPWSTPTDESLKRIQNGWAALGRELTIADICWFSNTEAGDNVARELSQSAS